MDVSDDGVRCLTPPFNGANADAPKNGSKSRSKGECTPSAKRQKVAGEELPALTRVDSGTGLHLPKYPPLLFSGNASKTLSANVAEKLGVALGAIKLGRFADGEVSINVLDSVRGKNVYLLQSVSAYTDPNGNRVSVNDSLMELLLLISTMRRASARRITAVVPYYAYARQDRKLSGRVPISAADVARLLECSGVDRVIAIDLHCGQIQGFFPPRVPCDNLVAGVVGIKYFGDLFASGELTNPVVISPDAGSLR